MARSDGVVDLDQPSGIPFFCRFRVPGHRSLRRTVVGSDRPAAATHWSTPARNRRPRRRSRARQPEVLCRSDSVHLPPGRAPADGAVRRRRPGRTGRELHLLALVSRSISGTRDGCGTARAGATDLRPRWTRRGPLRLAGPRHPSALPRTAGHRGHRSAAALRCPPPRVCGHGIGQP